MKYEIEEKKKKKNTDKEIQQFWYWIKRTQAKHTPL